MKPFTTPPHTGKTMRKEETGLLIRLTTRIACAIVAKRAATKAAAKGKE